MLIYDVSAFSKTFYNSLSQECGFVFQNGDFIEVQELGYQKHKKRRGTALRGLGPGAVDFSVHNNSLTNTLRALMERAFLVKHPVDGKLTTPPVAQTAGEFREFGQKVVKEVGAVRRMDLQEFVDTCPTHRRKCYQNALDDYLSRRVLTEREAWIGLFIKAEKVNVTKKPDPAPRLIQPRKPLYNLMLGSYIRPLEHAVYPAIDRIWSKKVGGVGLRTVMKGVNSDECGSAIREAWEHMEKRSKGGVVAVGFDAARWDQHCSVAALKEEHRVYNDVFRSSELRWLLKQQLVTKGVTRVTDVNDMLYKVKYQRTGGRCSGDMNTALGNVLLACGYMYQALINYDCFLINNGDDCVVIFTKESYKRFSGTCSARGVLNPKSGQEKFIEQWKSFGYTMLLEGEPTKVFEKIVFCQMQPVCVYGQWTMVRDMCSIDKDTHIVGRDATSIESWCHDVGVGGSIANAGVPVHSAFYKSFPRLKKANGFSRSSVAVNKFKWLNARITKDPDTPIADSTRVSYWRAFGIFPYDQHMYEEMFRKLKRGPALDPLCETNSNASIEAMHRRSRYKWTMRWGHDT